MAKVESNGGSSSYYVLPVGATQLQDLIEYRNMNAQQKEVFKASWRVGMKAGNDDIYDWNKIVYFALREIGRITGRKDYVTIAEELIGDQSEGDDRSLELFIIHSQFTKLSTNVLEAMMTVDSALTKLQKEAIDTILMERGAVREQLENDTDDLRRWHILHENSTFSKEDVAEIREFIDKGLKQNLCLKCFGNGAVFTENGLIQCHRCGGKGFETDEGSTEEVKASEKATEEVSHCATSGGTKVGEVRDVPQRDTGLFKRPCDHTEVCPDGHSETGCCVGGYKPDDSKLPPSQESAEEHF